MATWDKTKFVIYGPHRFEGTRVIMRDATAQYRAGPANTGALNCQNIQAPRLSIRAMLDQRRWPPCSCLCPFDPLSFSERATRLIQAAGLDSAEPQLYGIKTAWHGMVAWVSMPMQSCRRLA